MYIFVILLNKNDYVNIKTLLLINGNINCHIVRVDETDGKSDIPNYFVKYVIYNDGEIIGYIIEKYGYIKYGTPDYEISECGSQCNSIILVMDIIEYLLLGINIVMIYYIAKKTCEYYTRK